MKQKKLIGVLAAILVICGTSVFTACTSDNGDNPTPGGTTAEIVGRWTADVTGATATLWGDGKAMQTTELKSDGTGSTVTYYLLNDDIAVGRSHQTFRYTATADGQLTMNMDGSQQTATATWSLSDGRLTLKTDDRELTMQKADDATEKRMTEWNADEDLLDVPAPARYTVFVYGNAGGDMDNIIEEGLWERLKPLLTDQTGVRVMCFYKYGEETNSKYGYEGDIVWFELTSETDLDNLREEGLQTLGLGQEAKDMKLCDPATLQMFMRWSSLLCPAENYVFTIWGHGSGFEAMSDVPGKYATAEATRGVIADEWNDDEQLDMYELAYAIRSVSKRPFDNIYFHNCLMGNLETLTELRGVTDYITASAHVLSSDGLILAEYIRGLQDKGNTPEAIDQMFSRAGEEWKQTYLEESLQESPHPYNGDLKLLRTDRIDPILSATKRLTNRLVAQYPTQKEAIDRATCSVYRFMTPESDEFPSITCPFFDLVDYAHQVADETGDAEFAAIAADIDAAFSDVFVHYEDVNWNEEQFLPHYTLSVCLVDHDTYVHDFSNVFDVLCNFNEGYEQTTFHQMTGWGTWLNTNQQLPEGNPTSGGGSGEDDEDNNS